MPDHYIDENAVGDDSGGSWANGDTDIENSVERVSGAIVADDEIFVANNHDHNYATGTTVFDIPGGVHFKSVDPSDDSYSPGAIERATGASSYDLAFAMAAEDTYCMFSGISFEAANDIQFATANTRFYFKDGDLILSTASSSNDLRIYDDGICLFLDNVGLNFGDAGNKILMRAGTLMDFRGVYGAVGHTKVNVLFSPAGLAGQTMHLSASDLGSIVATNGALLEYSAAGTDKTILIGRRCTLPAGMEVFATTPTVNFNYFIDIAECGEGDNYSYFLHMDGELGQAEMDEVTYLSDDYDGTTNFSAQIDTFARAEPLVPYVYPIFTFEDQDLTTAKTVTIELTGPAGLKTNQVFARGIINDTTDEALGVVISSQPADALDDSTALTTSTESWTSAGAAKYKIELNLGAQTGVDHSNVDVEICVGSGAAISALNVAIPTIAAT